MSQLGPATGYLRQPCPECGDDVIVTFQGYRVDAEPVHHSLADCGLMMLPGGQVLLASSGSAEENRYQLHDHQPEGLE